MPRFIKTVGDFSIYGLDEKECVKHFRVFPTLVCWSNKYDVHDNIGNMYHTDYESETIEEMTKWCKEHSLQSGRINNMLNVNNWSKIKRTHPAHHRLNTFVHYEPKTGKLYLPQRLMELLPGAKSVDMFIAEDNKLIKIVEGNDFHICSCATKSAGLICCKELPLTHGRHATITAYTVPGQIVIDCR